MWLALLLYLNSVSGKFAVEAFVKCLKSVSRRLIKWCGRGVKIFTRLSSLSSSHLNNSVRSGWLPPGQLETAGLNWEDLDIARRRGSAFICHHHHNGVRSLTLGVDHSDADEVLGVHAEAGEGVAGGGRVGDPHLLGLGWTRVSRSEADHVSQELTMHCWGRGSTPLQVYGGGGGVVSC